MNQAQTAAHAKARSPERVGEMLRLRREGWSLDRISAAVHACKTTVRAILTEHGVPTNDPAIRGGYASPVCKCRPGRKRKISPDSQLNAPLNGMPKITRRDRKNILLFGPRDKARKPKTKFRIGRPWTCLVCNRVVPEGAVRCREHGGEFSLTINAKSRII